MAPHEGGPPRVVAGLTVAQRALGIDAHVLCGDGMRLPGYLDYWQAHAPGFPAGNAHTFIPTRNGLGARAMALREWLAGNLAAFDVVHIHHLWRLVPTLAGYFCRQLGVPYLIAPHTSLSPWALGQKKLKKQLARLFVWNRILKRASGFHSLNDLEAEEIRGCMGRTCPRVFVVPNGVSLTEFPERAASSVSDVADGRPYILFLARLHTMKGPDLLLEAFAGVAAAHPEMQLVFAGPDYGMLAALQRRTAELQLTARVRFLGLVSGSERLSLLRNALCLSQPSRDEGFSLSILEAMASGCPVVISEHCKFPDVARRAAGIIVPLSVPELAAALRSYAEDAPRRALDGRSARRLIEESYTWDIVGATTVRMYSSIQRGPPS